MIDLIGSESPVARVVLAIALDVALKATLLLALTIAAHTALGRRRALVRSALWNACIAGLLFMPVASWGLPRLRILILPTVQVGVAAWTQARTTTPEAIERLVEAEIASLAADAAAPVEP